MTRHHLSPVLALLLVIVAPAVAPSAASAFQPRTGGDAGEVTGLEVPLPALERGRLTPLVVSEPTAFEIQAATANLPGRWEVQWNRLTGTPHRIYGSGLDLAPGGFGDAAEVDAVSRAFVDRRPELAGVAPGDLHLLAIEHAAGHWSAIYEQAVNGVPVEGARVDFLYAENGRLVLFGSDAYPAPAVATAPALAAGAALAAGSLGLPAPAVAAPPELRILPVPAALPGEEEIRAVHHLAYRMILETAEPLGRWVTWVDAQSGRILWRYDDIRYLEITGRVTGDVEDPGYCDGITNYPFKDLTVNVTAVPSVFTNANGDYSATVPDNSTRTVTAMLRGRRVRIQNNGGANASFSGQTTPGNPLNLTWASAQADERDVYYQTTRTYDFIRSIDPTTPLGLLDGQLLANVSIASTCNAFWDGSSINFFREGGGCANTGRIGDVVMHEYGHGVSQFVYSPLGIPPDMGEGNSDIIANHMTERSLIGDGFNLGQCGFGIRDCNNTLRYPEDVVGQEPHTAGRVICGYDWDVRKNLEVLNPPIFRSHSDSLWHYTRLLAKPQTQPDQATIYFFLDDDDADITNGSPHYDAICGAAFKHGFPLQGPASNRPVSVTHSPLHSTTNASNPYEVVATITSTAGAIDVSQTRLHYRVNGGAEVDVPMTPTGNPNQYHGFIPAQQVGSRVTYTITTADVAGNPGSYPSSPCFPETPNGTEVFHIATTLDELEVDSGWTVGAPGDNATTGVWVRVDPNGTAAQPENDRTPAPGTMCFVTGQGTPGGPLGENDVDGGKTTLLTPVYNLSSFASAEILYHRWYSNDTGAAPNQDFWVADVSNDGGTNWVNVENTNLTDARWREVRINLNQVFGGPPSQVRVRFVASDFDPGSLVEAGVDEIMIFASNQIAIDDAGTPRAVPSRFALGPNVPNPFNPATRVSFELPERAPVTLLVFDVRGRLARTLADHVIYDAGSHELVWDGRDDQGIRVSSGVYQVQMAGPGFSETRKVVMVK